MADNAKAAAPLVAAKLVAVRPGFHDNRYLKPGDTFIFSGKTCPKWAAPAEKAPAIEKPKPLNGDTKPKDAQAAVKAKAAQANGDTGGLT